MNNNTMISKLRPARCVCITILLTCCISIITLKYFEQQYVIVAGKMTNLLVGNGFRLLSFNKDGLPVTYIARTKQHVVSPFYVVFCGLIYSRYISGIDINNNNVLLWQFDQSKNIWPIQPPSRLRTEKNFFNCVDWLTAKLKIIKGQWHIEYNFVWPYPNSNKGYLRPPWYSGITDSQAIILFLRAYDFTSNKKYLCFARRLYKSVMTPIKDGGALILDKDGFWIEEYPVQGQYTKVLNGMIYASLGIKCYEEYCKIKEKKSPLLINSIIKNASRYDLNYGTAYDRIGTLAKIKYHRIHTILMEELFEITRKKSFLRYYEKWKHYRTHFLLKYFFFHKPTINSIIVLIISIILGGIVSIILLTIALLLFTFLIRRDN